MTFRTTNLTGATVVDTKPRPDHVVVQESDRYWTEEADRNRPGYTKLTAQSTGCRDCNVQVGSTHSALCPLARAEAHRLWNLMTEQG